MPNWNSNKVTIYASISEVKKYLTSDEKDTMFKMPKFFPKKFKSDDYCGFDSWDYNWAILNTGSKWFPVINNIYSNTNDITYLEYNTARAPNNLLLERLHKMTNWTILNRYEEDSMEVKGILKCTNGKCEDFIYED